MTSAIIKEIWDVTKKTFNLIREEPFYDRNDLADIIEYWYEKGWKNGMSEGAEHAKQFQEYKEKYE